MSNTIGRQAKWLARLFKRAVFVTSDSEGKERIRSPYPEVGYNPKWNDDERVIYTAMPGDQNEQT